MVVSKLMKKLVFIMRIPMIIGNWKMNKGPQETTAFVQAIKGKLPIDSEVITVIAAPALDLSTLLTAAKDTSLKVASENSYFEEAGAYTGESSPQVLSEMGVTYGIVGYSERRGFFGENDAEVNRKAKALLRNNMLPILCVGENAKVHSSDAAKDWLVGEIHDDLADLTALQVARMTIAYEPIWAKETQTTVTLSQIQTAAQLIRQTINDLYDATTAQQVHVVYGGSVDEINIRGIMLQEDIDGVLVGTASLDPQTFLQLVHYNL